MKQEIYLLHRRRNELFEAYKSECDRLYKDLYKEDVDALNKQINALLFKEEIDALNKEIDSLSFEDLKEMGLV